MQQFGSMLHPLFKQILVNPDEHGQKIELKAEEAGITPKEFVDNVSTEIKRIWTKLE